MYYPVLYLSLSENLFTSKLQPELTELSPILFFKFNIYVEIEKNPYMTGIQPRLLTILTEMLTVSGLRCDILDQNSPVTSLGGNFLLQQIARSVGIH